MRKYKKVLIIFISIMLMFFTVQCIISQAADDIYSEVSTLATTSVTNGAVDATNNIAGSVISIAKVVCAGVAIIMITVIAMKYMMAAPSEKADIKKHAVVYIVGAVIMFAATGILTIIQNFAVAAFPDGAGGAGDES